MNGAVQYLQSHIWQTAVHTKHNLALGNPQSSGQEIKMGMDGGESHTLLSLIVHRLRKCFTSICLIQAHASINEQPIIEL